MASEFQSVFSSNKNVNSSLDELFKKKAPTKKTKTSKKSKNENNEDELLKDITSDIEENDKEEEKIDASATRTKVRKINAETENRTVFVGNLHFDCKKEELLKIFKSYGKIECVRFRNIVPEDLTKSKKYSFITKQQHPNKKNINAFVRFANVDAAKTAANELNGMEYKSLHLRVDIAARSKVHDNKKSVFLGALPFDVTDEDVYQHFSQCGPIDFVRVIRDNKTGIGKGFGYVQFKTADTVALALKLDGSNLNERKIRVNRCVKKQKAKQNDVSTDKNSKKGNFNKRERIDKISDVLSKRDKKSQSKPESSISKKKKKFDDIKTNKTAKGKQNEVKLKKKKKLAKKRRHVSTNNKERNTFKI